MKKYPKLRCPVCGMVVWLRNLVGFHPVDAFEYTFGIGKGKILVKHSQVSGDLIGYWIQRLKEVIVYLESEREKMTKVSKVEIPLKKFSVVSETSVLPMMELKLNSTPSTILNVPKPSLVISTKKKEKMSK